MVEYNLAKVGVAGSSPVSRFSCVRKSFPDFFYFTGNSSCKAKTLRGDAHAAPVVVWLLMQPRGSARVPLAELFVLGFRLLSVKEYEDLFKG